LGEDALSRLLALVDRTLELGSDRLPPEPELSETLGISRGRLRTLLKRLEAEGAIWRQVGKGTFIGPRKLIEAPALSASFSVDDVLQARHALEPQLAAQAAIHATRDDLDEMNRCLAEMQNAASMLQWKRLDERLHRAVAQATHNNLLLALYDTLRAHMKWTLDKRIDQIFGAEPGPKKDTHSEHVGFVEAIRLNDPEGAELAMREHIVRLRSKLFGLR